MYISNNQQSKATDQKPSYKRRIEISEPVKLGATVAAVASGAYIAGNAMNNRLKSAKSEDYFKALFFTGSVLGGLYLATRFTFPMWKEVTEYRYDRSPFSTARTYYNPQKKILEKLPEQKFSRNFYDETSLYYL